MFARSLSAGGVPVGTEFQLNSYTTEEQDDPRVAALEDGRFVVVWESTGQDKSLGGIFGQLYSAGDLCGDADDNGQLTIQDAFRVLRASGGVGTCALCQCDADGDGTIEVTDALAVLRAAIGFTGSLACDPC